MKFEDVLYNKNEYTQDCNNIINHVKNCCKDYDKYESNTYVLVKLLDKKIDILHKLKYDNYDEISSELKTINEQIYKQIKIFKNDVFNDFKNKDEIKIEDEIKNPNSQLNSKYNLGYIKEKINKKNTSHSSKEIKKCIFDGMKDFISNQDGKNFNNFIINNIKNISLNFKNVSFIILLSFLIGLIPFALYFFIEIKNVSSMQGLDIFYLVIMLGVAAFIYLFLLLLLPFSYFGIIEISCLEYKNYESKNIRKYFIISNIVSSLAVIGLVFLPDKLINDENIISFIVILILAFVSIVTCIIYCKNNKNKFELNKEFILMFIFTILISSLLLLMVFFG
ncbi:hypothetical protein F1B92_04240 [Campylobacter sp. FMV-PI01]|uniref:Uncharacterized protein n=1 Tax=Campylobacter portucalensis TaxID=2608384 RepID=A0A6L5WHM4_9BACT|nr:hypothetical protein [Campylobacter portucalensis]MSN96396.1 hypothetical protein [Campylobacter portucalensis]